MTRLFVVLVVLIILAIAALAVAVVLSVGFTAAALLDDGQARVA
jgi:hypothetical protein